MPAQASTCTAVAALQALQHADERIEAARHVKNAVVGNPTNKRLYLSLGALPALLAAASPSNNPKLTEQAVAAIGSLAVYFPQDAYASVVPTILSTLFSDDQRPVSAAVRALKLILCSPSVQIDQISPQVVTSRVATRLVQLIAADDDGIAEVCAVIISKSCQTIDHSRVFNHADAIPALVALLHRTNHERCVEACLNALSALAALDHALTHVLTQTHNLTPLLLPLTRSSVHTLRLAACHLLTIFHSAAQLPSGVDAIVATALVELLHAEDVPSQIATAYTLADLVQITESLQRIATEASAIPQLATIVKGPSVTQSANQSTHTHLSTASQTNDYFMRDQPYASDCAKHQSALQTSAFTALAAICSQFDEAREKLIDQQILPSIVKSMSSFDSQVVLASMKCLHSLSKSVTIVKRDIRSDTIATRLLGLLSSDNIDIKRCASAAVCNLILGFSLVRGAILSAGGIEKLVNLLQSDDDEVRKNAMWALRNLLFGANSVTKNAVMSVLGYDNLLSLCVNEHARVRELAMTIVRNLAYPSSDEVHNEQLDALFAATGDRLISLLSSALKLDRENSEIAEQALYAVCNIAAGTEAHKACLMKSDIPKLILQWTSHQNERARIAAIWCATNLSCRGRPVSSRRPVGLMRQRHRTSGRTALNRLDLLQRQHLPLPSSPVDRAELEISDSTDHDGSSPESSQQNGYSLDTDMGTGSASPTGHEDQQVESSTTTDQDAEMSVAQEEEQHAPKSSGYEWRISRLRELGFEGRLRSLVNDPHVEVQGRARHALEMFDCEDVRPLDCSPSALLDYSPSALLGRQSPRSAPALLRVAESDSSSAGST